jgi:ubiquinone/menaquinone biosynthesis C-methylase UbiE
MNTSEQIEKDERYFTALAAAFVRGKISGLIDYSDDEAIAQGRSQGLRLHKFKCQTELPRIKKVLGVLQGLAPLSLLDIGSGRGTFLWPLLDAFPYLEITAIDMNPIRVNDINAVRAGGFTNLQALQMDAMEIKLDDKSVDVVTALEVLEHLEKPALAAAEAVRLARKFVVASVPSKEDDNPEHIQLFDSTSFEKLWLDAGAKSVSIEYVLNHIIAVVKV